MIAVDSISVFLAQYGVEIVLAICIAAALGFCRGIWSQMRKYGDIITQHYTDADNQRIDTSIDEKLDPIRDEIEELRAYIRKQQDLEKSHLTLILASYKFRLIQLCKTYLKRGYITSGEYEQLLEFYKVYDGLGGNGQAKEFYEKTIKLPIQDDE